MISPRHGQAIPTMLPVLVAEPGRDAEGDQVTYRFQIATDAHFTAGPEGSLIGDFSWTSRGLPVPASWSYRGSERWLLDNRSYWWRVTALDRDGQSGDWSTARLDVRDPQLGTGGNWPFWSNGPLAINEANGNLVLRAPTPSFPTAAGPLGVTITYNSLDTVGQGFGSGSTGWTVGPEVDEPLRLINHAVIAGDGQHVVERVYADGRATFYQHIVGSLVYLPPPDSASQLTKSGDGETFTLIDDDGYVYTFAKAATYASTGILELAHAQSYSSQINVGRIDFGYSGGKLTTVTAKNGSTTIATVSLSWSCAGAMLCVTGPDGVVWRYVGTGSGGASGSLQTVNDGTRDVLKISYDASGRPQVLLNANDLSKLSGSPDPSLNPVYDSGHRLLLGYDGSNRATSVSAERVSGQTPTTSTWSFAYATGGSTHASVHHGGARAAAGNTTITPPCQQGPGTCPGRSGSRRIKVFYDDRLQEMERIDLLGRYTLVSYNTSSQMLWSEDADGNPTDYAYDLVDKTLTSVTGPDPDGAGGLDRPVTRFNYDEKAYGAVSGTSYTPGAALTGVQATYFKTPNLVSPVAGAGGRADLIASNPNGVYVQWGTDGPPDGQDETNFSARFVGVLTVPATGSTNHFVFQIQADEGVRMTLGGQLVIDRWTNHNGAYDAESPALTLPPGKYRVVVENSVTDRYNSYVLLNWRCSDGPACAWLPQTFNSGVPLTPAWSNLTSTVSPFGRVAFSHFDRPWTGAAQYTLAKAPVAGTTSSLITSFGYDGYGRITGKVMPKGNTGATINSSTGDLSGGESAATSSYGTTYAYYGDTATAATPDTSGLLTGCPGPSTPSQLGLLQRVTQHGLSPVTTIYDAAGRPVSVTNAKGTALSCYIGGRLRAAKAATDANPTTYTYDPAGNLVSSAHGGAGDSTAGTLRSTYDESGRITYSTDANGAEAAFTYDAGGNTLTRRAANGPLAPSQAMVVSGGEVSDAVRSAGVEGDGRPVPDSSYGVWDATTNLFANGGLESDTVRWGQEAGVSTIERTTGQSKFGSASLLVTLTGSGSPQVNAPSQYSRIPVAAGTTYTFSAWVKQLGGAARSLKATILWTNSFGDTFSAEAGVVVGAQVGSYRRVVVSAAAPAGAVTAWTRVELTGAAAGETFSVDGAQFEAQRLATPYVHTDGASASRSAGRVELPASVL
ncbi:MAG: phage head spike fiber domain-containing protein, partial [Actinomycetota bacterium]